MVLGQRAGAPKTGNQVRRTDKDELHHGRVVQDVTSFYDSYNDSGGDLDRSNRNIATHWVAAPARNTMPVRSRDFKLFSREQTPQRTRRTSPARGRADAGAGARKYVPLAYPGSVGCEGQADEDDRSSAGTGAGSRA
jgi:hypothetical protein